MFGINDYLSAARARESAGDPNAQNPRSSAAGLYQFTDGTWNDLANRYPNLGLTPDGRFDPNQQQRAMTQFTNDNAGILSQKGLPVNDQSLYAMHRFGAAGGPKLLSSDPNAPIDTLVDPKVMRANPDLNGKTVGQALAFNGVGAPQGSVDGTSYGATPQAQQGRTPGNFGPSSSYSPAQTIMAGKRPDGTANDPTGFLAGGPGAFIGLPNGMTSGGYDVGTALQGAGAGLASISSPSQGAALAALQKPIDGFSMHMNPKTGQVFRINTKNGDVQAVTGPGNNNQTEAYDTKLGQELVDWRKKIQSDAQSSRASNIDLDTLEKALSNPNIPQGGYAPDARLALMRVANTLGIDNAKDLSDADVANSVSSKLALKLRSPADGGGMPGNFSDADRNFVTSAAAGMKMTHEASMRLIELARAANNRSSTLDDMRRDYERSHGNRLDTGFEQVVADWDKNNTFKSKAAMAEEQGGGPAMSAGVSAPASRPPLSSIFK